MARMYKCGYSHCCRPDELVSIEDSEKVGKRRWHIDCVDTKVKIDFAKKLYFEYIDRTAEYKIVVGVMNNIVFKKGYSADALVFLMKYIIAYNCKVKSPYVLHTIISNGLFEKKFNDLKMKADVEDRYAYREREIRRSEDEDWR